MISHTVIVFLQFTRILSKPIFRTLPLVDLLILLEVANWSADVFAHLLEANLWANGGIMPFRIPSQKRESTHPLLQWVCKCDSTLTWRIYGSSMRTYRATHTLGFRWINSYLFYPQINSFSSSKLRVDRSLSWLVLYFESCLCLDASKIAYPFWTYTLLSGWST